MKNKFFIPIIVSVVSILVTIHFPLYGQMTNELKDFLWEKDINEMVTRYGEQTIILSDSGDYQRRLARRTFREEPGLRIQTFAGADLKNAEKSFETLVQMGLDSVYLIQEDELYKVQLGNFLYRLDAEKMLDRLRFAGLSNAWIVESTIHLPRDRSTDTTEVTSSAVRGIEPQFVYSIQVFVTRDSGKAAEFRDQINNQMLGQSWILQSGEFWKVMIGKFPDEAPARQQLWQIREAGYADAWLTQVSD